APCRLAGREVRRVGARLSGPGILLEPLDLDGRPPTVIVAPGRALGGPAGLLLTRVEYEKEAADRSFLVVDAAMNDLLRPALYDAHHDVVEVAPRPDRRRVDVAGPVCETADTLARDRELGARAGDLLAVLDVGAYGMVMASNYNARPRAAEVLVDAGAMHLVRERETPAMLFAGERRLPG
ncbi:MAG: diaminopimelate decarboxylase family protein, partial [Actinomycetota bacterium]